MQIDREFRQQGRSQMKLWKVHITCEGFSHCNLTVDKNDIVQFDWSQDVASEQFCVTQVVESEESVFAVPNGLYFDLDHKGSFKWQSRLAGSFFFVCSNSSFVLSIAVDDRHLSTPSVSWRNGCFSTNFISVSQEPRPLLIESESELLCCTFALSETGFTKTTRSLKRRGDSKIYELNIEQPIRCFIQPKADCITGEPNDQNDSNTDPNFLIVDVTKAITEHRMPLNSDENQVLRIQCGDKVWFSWENSTEPKSVFQIELSSNAKEQFLFQRKIQSSFIGDLESVNGLCCHQFEEVGIFHFAVSESSPQIISIEVCPSPEVHQITLGPNSKSEDFLEVQLNDIVWFQWPEQTDFGSQFIGTTEVLPKQLTSVDENGFLETTGKLTPHELSMLSKEGKICVPMTNWGVFQYIMYPVCPLAVTIAVQPPTALTHYVNVTFSENPRLEVCENDSIVWKWDSDSEVSITEVSAQGKPSKQGFKSGPPKYGPVLMGQRFEASGVHYYMDRVQNSPTGCVVVGERRNKIVKHFVRSSKTTTDFENAQIRVSLGDIVLWICDEPSDFDVNELGPHGEICNLENPKNVLDFIPRRCRAYQVRQPKLKIFGSQAWSGYNIETTLDSISSPAPSEPSGHLVEQLGPGREVEFRTWWYTCAVMLEENGETKVIRMMSDGRGFDPHIVSVRKNDSVLWKWETKGVWHNVYRVEPPDDKLFYSVFGNISDYEECPLDLPCTGVLKPVNGELGFNSGQPSENGSYAYSFTRAGIFHVSSHGCNKNTCVINVLDTDEKTETPRLVTPPESSKDMVVKRGQIVELGVKDSPEETFILYTLDGRAPSFSNGIKLYRKSKAIVLDKIGFYVIRAVAVRKGFLDSVEFVSKTFQVVEKPSRSMGTEEIWDNIHLDIVLTHLGNGVIQVSWMPKPSSCKHLVFCYQLTVNSVIYCAPFNRMTRSCRVFGLEAAVEHALKVVAIPNSHSLVKKYSPTKLFTIDRQSSSGAPLISIEFCPNEPASFCVVWPCLVDPKIQQFLLLIDGETCGQPIIPDSETTRFKVALVGCALDEPIRVCVAAKLLADETLIYSNEVKVTLPLETKDFVFPDAEKKSETFENFGFVTVKCGHRVEDRVISSRASDVSSLSNQSSISNVEVESEKLDEKRNDFAYEHELRAIAQTLATVAINSAIGDINRELNKQDISEETSATGNNKLEQTKGSEMNQLGKQEEKGEENQNIHDVTDDSEEVDESVEKEETTVDETTKSSTQDVTTEDKTTESVEKDETEKDETTESLGKGETTEDESTKSTEKVPTTEFSEKDETTEFSGKVDTAEFSEKVDTAEFSEKDQGSEKCEERDANEASEKDASDKIETKCSEERDKLNQTLAETESLSYDLEPQMQSTVPVQENQYSREPDDSDYPDVQSEAVENVQETFDNSRSEENEVLEEKIDLNEGISGLVLERDSSRLSQTPKSPSLQVVAESSGSVTFALNVPKKFTPESDENHEESEMFLKEIILSAESDAFASNVESLYSSKTGTGRYRHNWSVQLEACEFSLNCLLPNKDHVFLLCCKYACGSDDRLHSKDVILRSPQIYLRTLGAPEPPILSIKSVDLQEATLQWEISEKMPTSVELSGFSMFVNDALYTNLPPQARFITLTDLKPGVKHEITIQTLVNHTIGPSSESEKAVVRVPPAPPPLNVSVREEKTLGSVAVFWTCNSDLDSWISQTSFLVYVGMAPNSNTVLHGKIPAKDLKREGDNFVYALDRLKIGQTYNVFVQAEIGAGRIDKSGKYATCGVRSELSVMTQFTVSAPPISPKLAIAGFDNKGVDLEWEPAVTIGNALVSGYCVVRDKSKFSRTLGPEVLSFRIEDLNPGDVLNVRLIALTDHPVGQTTSLISTNREESGVDFRHSKKSAKGLKGDDSGDRFERPLTSNQTLPGYPGCLPGPKLIVDYNNLVSPPTDVVMDFVSAHNATVSWNVGLPQKQPFLRTIVDDDSQPFYRQPEHFMVYLGDRDSKAVRTFQTANRKLNIIGLKPDHQYLVHVESRRMQSYTSRDNTGKVEQGNFLVSHKTQPPTQFRTGAEPRPAKEFKVASTTSNSISLKWTHPDTRGYKLLGYRIELDEKINHEQPEAFTSKPAPLVFSLSPTEQSYVIEDLPELTCYDVTLMTVSDRFFENSDVDPSENYDFPTNVDFSDLQTSSLLPSVTIQAETSASESSLSLILIESAPNFVTLKWSNSGLEAVSGQRLTWKNCLDPEAPDKGIVELQPETNMFQVQKLNPGKVYEFALIALCDLSDNSTDTTGVKEVAFNPLMCRTPDPVTPPLVCIQSYTSSQLCVTWDRPCLTSLGGVQHELVGYVVLVNGGEYTKLSSSATTCFLTKCRPGKSYSIAVTAITRATKKKLRFQPTDISEAELLNLSAEDTSTSISVSIKLPEKRVGNIHKVSCSYSSGSIIAGSKTGSGVVTLEWTLFHTSDRKLPADMGVLSYEVVWEELEVTDSNEVNRRSKVTEKRVKIAADESEYDIEVKEPGSFIEACVIVNTRTSSSVSEKVCYRVPFPPNAPEVILKSISAHSIAIQWREPATTGANSIAGYQVYLDGKKAGNVLNKNCFKAMIPYKLNRKYEVQVVALSSNSEFPDSEPSDVVLVSTYPEDIARYLDGGSGEKDTVEVVKSARPLDADLGVTNIELTVVSITDCSITVEVKLLEKGLKINEYHVEWNSISSSESNGVIKLKSNQSQFTLEGLRSGTNHFIRVHAFNKHNDVVAKSKQLTVLTATPLAPPIVELVSAEISKVVIKWKEPSVSGDALIVGYKVFINSKLVAQLDSEESDVRFEYTKGLMCREYCFQVQALSTLENLDSELSRPLLVLWPGVVAPTVECLPTTRQNAIRIGWHPPFVAGSVKLLGFIATCEQEEATSPGSADAAVKTLTLEPEACEAEFTGLASETTHRVFLQVKAVGLEELVVSNVVETTPSLLPDAPLISVDIRNAQERRQLDEQACSLFNKRDKFLRMIHFVQKMALNGKFMSTKNEEVELIKLGSALAQIDADLTETVSKIARLTGKVEVMLSWEGGSNCQDFTPRPKSRSFSLIPGNDGGKNQKMEVSGYKVFLNGRQYGLTVNSDVKNMVLRMNADKQFHKISLLALSGNNSCSTSGESNIILVPTETFKPLSLFCFIKAHSKNSKWPQSGCCILSESLPYERHQIPQAGSTRDARLISPGSLRKVTPCPSVDIFNIFARTWEPLFPISGSHAKYTILLFWTSWCSASQNAMKYFLGFARENQKLNFVTCCVGSGDGSPEHYTDVYEVLATYPDSMLTNVTHTCGCLKLGGLNSSHEQRPLKRRPQSSRNSLRSSSVAQNNAFYSSPADLFGVQGVPMMFIINEKALITWQARYAVCKQEDLDSFLQEALAELDKNESNLTVGKMAAANFIQSPSSATQHSRVKREVTELAMGSSSSMLFQEDVY